MATPKVEPAGIGRPRPPQDLIGIKGALAPSFVPAPELRDWARASFIEQGAPLHNEDHEHLLAAVIECVWTSAEARRHGRSMVGQCEFKPPSGSMNKWAKGRMEAQLYGWFGHHPDFLLTFYAPFAAECSDVEFCALVEHELYHCGQAMKDGAPVFTKEGMPIFAMRGHDVEDFIGIARRYGIVGKDMAALVEAAQAAPLFEGEAISRICGTCA